MQSLHAQTIQRDAEARTAHQALFAARATATRADAIRAAFAAYQAAQDAAREAHRRERQFAQAEADGVPVGATIDHLLHDRLDAFEPTDEDWDDAYAHRPYCDPNEAYGAWGGHQGWEDV